MASRKSIHISGHYVVWINAMTFHIYTLCSKKIKGRTESYFILFLKLNDHQTRCFSFGLLWRARWYDGCSSSIPGTNMHAGKISSRAQAPTTETTQFSVLGEKAPSHPSNLLKVKAKAVRGRTPEDPTHPVGTSPLYGHQHVTTSPSSPEKKESKVTPSDADMPDSITKALLDALQKKRTGNQLPATKISLVRVRASQLQQCLVTGREASEGTIQATLDLISLGQVPSTLINLVDTSIHGETYVRVYLESTEDHCACTDPGEVEPLRLMQKQQTLCIRLSLIVVRFVRSPHADLFRDTHPVSINIK